MPTLYTVIRRPLITEKGLSVKETEGTLVFDVAPEATKTEVKQAVETLFKVKVTNVRTATVDERVEIPHRRRQTRVTDLSRNHGHPAILIARDQLCDRRKHLSVTPTPRALRGKEARPPWPARLPSWTKHERAGAGLPSICR